MITNAEIVLSDIITFINIKFGFVVKVILELLRVSDMKEFGAPVMSSDILLTN